MNLNGPPAQRACLSHVSLVQAPESLAPRPVARPDDLHPLPDNIDAYFVYPFSVEELVTSPHTLLTSDSVHALHERHANFLRMRKEKGARGAGALPPARSGLGSRRWLDPGARKSIGGRCGQ